MDARRRRPPPSCPRAAAPPLLLLLVVSLGVALLHGAAAAAGDMTTELQKHATFFDRDHDGIVTMDETYQGMRDVGLEPVAAKAAAVFSNAAGGPMTRPDNASLSSSPMDIYIQNIYKMRHGSDAGAYDAQGRFVPAKLEEMFAKYVRTVPNAMTKDELDEKLRGNRDSLDVDGWLIAKTEWELLYSIAKDGTAACPRTP